MRTPLLVVALCFLLSHLQSQVHRRKKQLEVESGKGDFVSTKRYWTHPKSCGSQSLEAPSVHVVHLARQSRAMVFAWWNPCIIRPQTSQISQDSQIDFVFISCVFYSLCGQAIIAAAGRRLWRRRAFRKTSSAAGAHVLFNFMSCPPRLSKGLLFGMHVLSSLAVVFTETGVAWCT